MKLLNFAVMILLCTQIAIAQNTLQTNVACVGNSITEGYGLSYQEDYPYQLQQILGSNYNVTNFGVSSMTFAKPTIKAGSNNSSYWSTEKFKSSLNSEPNIVVIELGTNDSKYFMNNYAEKNIYNYNYSQCEKQQLYADYEALIDTFVHLQTSPKIFATLQPYSNNIKWAITDSAIVNQINPIIKQTAIEKGINIIDLHSQFNTPAWYLADSVHPNPTGAQELAKIVQKYITINAPTIAQDNSTLKVNSGYEFYWYKNGTKIENAKNNTLQITETGTYKALVKIDEKTDSWIATNEFLVTNLDAGGSTKILKHNNAQKRSKLNHKVDVKGRTVK